MGVIHKIGGLIIKDRNFLVGKKKDTFILPGGKIRDNETHEACLKRELKEEFQVELKNLEYFGTFEDDAALDPGMRVRIETYLVDFEGELKPSAEIKDMEFINSETDLKIASIIRKFIIPELKKKDLID